MLYRVETMVSLLLIGALLAPAGPVGATLADQVRDCQAVRNAASRLACFDAMTVPAPVTRSPRWRASSRTMIDNEPHESLSILSVLNDAVLILQCQAGATAIMLITDMPLGEQYRVHTTFWVDDGPPVHQRWDRSQGAAGRWTTEGALPVIWRLLEAEQFQIRLAPRGRASRVFLFRVTGLADVIEPLEQGCNWPQWPRSNS